MLLARPATSLLALVVCAGYVFGRPVASETKGKAQYQRLIVFGDSFSDSGKGASAASNGTWPANPAYYGHRFSNGPVWAEYLAKDLNVTLYDYAAGGATADNDFVHGYTGYYSNISVPSTNEQEERLLSTKGNFTAKDIAAVFIGANDAFFNQSITAADILGLIDDQISTLMHHGAKNVLLLSYPNLSVLPASIGAEATYNDFLSDYSVELRKGLFGLQAQYCKQIHIGVVDIFTLFRHIIANPKKFGYDPKLVRTPFLKGVYPGENLPPATEGTKESDDPDEYIFWDIYHPTTKSHRYVADLARKTVFSEL